MHPIAYLIALLAGTALLMLAGVGAGLVLALLWEHHQLGNNIDNDS